MRKKRVLCAAMRVDLNPARAAMCDTLAESDHTTIQRRLREREQLRKRRLAGKNLLDRPLKPVAGLDADALLDMTESHSSSGPASRRDLTSEASSNL